MPGMTVGSSGGGTVAFEHTDLSPSSAAVQGLQLNAPGVAQAGVTANFDGILQSKAFINLNGTYTLTFRAKATSGNPILGYTVYRVGNTPFLSGTVNPTVNVSPGYGWTNYSFSFTASETGSQNSTGQVWLNATGGTVLLQDMALTEAPTGGNPTVFRNAVYQKLVALHPGMLRDMTTYSWGCSSENMMLAAASARVNCGFNSYLNIGQPISYGWSDFLQLSHAVGATAAWITISAFTTPTQMDEIAAYLSGTCGNGNAWTTQRCNYGQTAPWTSLFPGGIYLELGNEIWNSPNGENLYGNGGQNYGQLAGANVAALKASSYYASNIKFVASGFILASDYEYGWNQTVLAAMGSHLPDYIDGAPYMYYDMTDLSSLANIFGPMFAEPYNFVSPTYGAGTGYTYGLQSFTATNYPGVNGAVYETNLATTCALTGTTQTQINQVVGGLGAGLDATLTMLLAARDAGVLLQNFFAFPEDVNQFGLSTSTASGSCSLLNTYTPYQPLWGSNLFMPGPTNAQSIDRPSGIALQLVNNAMGSNLNLLNTVQTGTPTYNQPAAQPNPTSWPTPGLDSISANSAVPYVSAFGFGDGAGNYSLIVYNTNLTGSEAITFSGPGAPTGTVTKTVFTSGNITDNNEGLSIGSTPVVTYPTSTTISNPTGDTLPAVSVTTYTWTSGGSSGPSIAVGSSLSPSTYGQSVTFTATLTGTSTAPTGSVTFLNGGTAIGTANLTVTGALTSTATFTTSTLPGGTDAITVSYASASSPAFNQVVNSGSVTAAVTSSLNPSVYGQSTTLTATVNGVYAAPTGSVTFMNGATSLGSATLTPDSGLSSTATFATSTLPVGTDSVTAVYAATANFGAATSPAVSQVVSAASTTTTVASSLTPSSYGQSVNLTATVSGTYAAPTGSVTFMNGATSIGSATLTAGSGLSSSTTLTTSTLPVGTDSITAVYAGTANNGGSTSSALSQTVNAASTTAAITSSLSPSGSGQSITLTATISSGYAAPTGSVTFMNGATSIGSATLTPGSGLSSTATLATSTLPIGTDSLTVVYAATTNFGAATSTALSQIVSAASSTAAVASSLNPASAGQSVTFTATLTSSTAAPTGSVTFMNGATSLGSATLTAGGGVSSTATLSTSALPVGTDSITVVYAGTANFGAATSPALSQVINGASTTATVASSLNPANSGQTVTFTATVSSGSAAPTGSVTFMNGATSLGSATLTPGGGVSSTATFSTAALPAGTDPITVVYAATGSFGASTSSALNQVVNGASTTATVASSLNPANSGQTVTFTATVSSGSAAPTGSVTFMNGATSLGSATLTAGSGTSSTATLATAALPVGTDSITAVYAATVNFGASTSAVLSQVVNGGSTTATVTSSVSPASYAQSVTFTATVSSGGGAAPTGSVTFMNGATTMGSVTLTPGSGGNSTAAFTSAALPVGTDAITVVYAGNGSFGAATSPAFNQVINPAFINSAVLVSSQNPSSQNQPVTFTATFSTLFVAPTGSLAFTDGTTTLGTATLTPGSGLSSTASLTTSTLPMGTRSITAVYAATTDFGPVSSNTISQVVNAAASTTATVTSSVNPAGTGQSVTLTGTIVGVTTAPTGSVVFMDGATAIGTVTLTTAGGVTSTATLTTSTLPIGTDPITVVYAGNGSNGAATSAVFNQVVNPPASTATVASSVNPASVGQAVTFTATITSSGSAAPTGSVTLMSGTTSLGSATLTPGGGVSSTATLTTTSLPAGTDSITAVYAGTANFGAATSPALSEVISAASTTAAVASSVSPSSYGQTVTFTATVSSSNAAPTGSVVFLVGATPLGSATLAAGGGASSTATLSVNSLAVGTNSITVVYAATQNFAASTSSAISQVVNAASTTATVASSANPANSGQAVVLTATISSGYAAPAGPVVFLDGATPIGSATLVSASGASSTASISTSTLPMGTDPITVVYAATTNFGASTSTALSQVINNAVSSATLTSSQNPASLGQTVTLTASINSNSVVAGPPSGAVTFMDGPAVLAASQPLAVSGTTTSAVSFSVSTLTVGSHSITATYVPTGNFSASTASLTEVVNGLGSATVLTASPNPSPAGQTVTLTAVVSGGSSTSSGTVTFYNGATAIGSGTLDGSGHTSITTAGLAAGTDTLTAVYSGSPVYSGSTSAAVTETIQATPQDFSVALASPSLTVPTQSSQTTTVTLTSENGFSDTLSLSCSNLPTYVTCSVSPAASTLTANGTATTTLTIGTVSNFAYSPSDSGPLHPSDSPLNLALMLSPMGLLAGIAAFPKRRSRRLPRLYLFVLLLAAIPMALAFNGCATPSIIHELSSAAAGTYTIPVKATGANTGTNHTVQLTLTVTP
jgi:hypothetical protein